MSKPVYHYDLAASFDALDLDDLDDVVGGGGPTLNVPAGGSVRETNSSYSWWGMNYNQTTREALDSNGNVVGSEVVRPGSVWSDHTVTDDHGTSTEYSTGTSFGDASLGGGIHGSITTTTTNDGHYSVDGNVGGEVHATNTGFGDYSANGEANVHGDASADGLYGHADASGGLHATDPESGYSASLTGQAHADGHIDNNGVGYDVGAQANAGLAHNGEDLGSLQLGSVGTSGHVGYDEQGNLNAGWSGSAGAFGERATADVNGTYHNDGSIDGSATITNHFGTDGGKYGASADVSYGVQGGYHPDGSYDVGVHGGAEGQASLGNWSANGGVQGQVDTHWNGEGYQGADVSGSGHAGIDGPNGVGGSVSGNGSASFDGEGNFTGAQGHGEVDGHAFGQEYHNEGDFDSNGDNGGSYDSHDTGGSYDSHDTGGSYDTSSNYDGGGSSYDSGGSSYDGGGSSYDSGGTDYAGDTGGGDYA